MKKYLYHFINIIVIHSLGLHGGVSCSSRITSMAASNMATYETGAGVASVAGCWGVSATVGGELLVV